MIAAFFWCERGPPSESRGELLRATPAKRVPMRAAKPSKIDPITLSVVRGGLETTAARDDVVVGERRRRSPSSISRTTNLRRC